MNQFAQATHQTQEKDVLKKKPALIYRWLGDKIFATITITLGITIMALALTLAFVLLDESWEALTTFGLWGFISGTSWDASVKLEFGALPFIIGTLSVSFAALAISFLPAIAVAIFITEYAPSWLSQIIDNLVNLIAAIPSVVLGIWGIFVLVPWAREAFYNPAVNWAQANYPALEPLLGNPVGFGMATATIVLSLMILPYITALTKEAINLVPSEQREACRALGATRWETIRMAVIPYARGGIMAGSILSLGRAIGETMAVAMLIGNSNSLPFSLFGPAATMPSVIVNEFREAVGSLHLSSLMGIGFVLFLIAVVVNLLAAYITRKFSFKGGRDV